MFIHRLKHFADQQAVFDCADWKA